MTYKTYKKQIIIIAASIILLGGIGYVAALNGWFGAGSSAVPADTMTNGLVGYWNFEEGGGGTVKDSSGNGKNGTIKTGQEKEGWLYKIPVTVSNSGSTLMDFQVSVTINTAALVSAGKMQSDCDDVRFVDSDNVTERNYWIESGCNTSSTKFWIKIPSIPNPGKTIYMYYGNPSATIGSNGANTFIWFDDFSGSSQWTASGTGTYGTSGEGYASASQTGTGNKTESLTTTNAVSTGDFKVGLKIYNTSSATGGSASHDYKFWQSVATTSDLYVHPTDDNASYVSKYYTVTGGTNPKLEFWVSATGGTVEVGGTCSDSQCGCSDQVCCEDPGVCGSIWYPDYADTTGSAELYVDDIFVRQYSATEPTITAGSEMAIDYSSQWTKGKNGGGLQFDGKDDYVTIGNVYNGVKTVSFWLKASNTTQKILDLNGTDYIQVSSGTITATGAGWVSPAIYVDGKVSSTVDTAWHFITITTATGINASAVNLAKFSTGYFDGVLDEVRIYNRALSAAEVAYHYNARKPAIRWEFNEGSGTTIHDSEGNIDITFPTDVDKRPTWTTP